MGGQSYSLICWKHKICIQIIESNKCYSYPSREEMWKVSNFIEEHHDCPCIAISDDAMINEIVLKHLKIIDADSGEKL